MAAIEYKTGNVLEAAQRRMAQVFDDFEDVVVSVSSGKDSTVIRHLAVEEAQRRGRQCSVFFLDQEAEYQSSIDVIEEWMADPRTVPEWYQVPTLMTNATSHAEYWLRAWWPGEEWLRPKSEIAIHEIEGKYPQRFYDFFEWRERQCARKTAFVVGLRARESFNRFRSVTKHPGHRDWCWTTKTKSELAVRVYPIFEWTFGDVWKYIADNCLRYNAHYDRMFAKYGINVSRMRVSNLVHEQAFRCLVDLQEFEPDTYDRLIRRLGGVHSAALYGKEANIFDAQALPPAFATWRAFRDYLLATTPIDKIERFKKRFAGQPEDDETCRRQCKQILINDWENNVPVANTSKAKLRALWWDRL